MLLNMSHSERYKHDTLASLDDHLKSKENPAPRGAAKCKINIPIKFGLNWCLFNILPKIIKEIVH